MTWVLALGGVAAGTLAWTAIRDGRSIWVVMPLLCGSLGILAIAAGTLDDLDPGEVGLQVALGVATGVGLFLATRLALVVLRHWQAFARDATERYAPAAGIGRPTVLALSLLVASGEELFWRGWVQSSSSAADLGTTTAVALVTWLAYVAANLASADRAIWAGAVVGGAVWGLVAATSGGVVASLVSHVAWTSLMIVLPPGFVRGKMQS